MLRAYYVEIKPNKTQKLKIHKTIGVCRFVYNFYIAHNQENYKNGGKFVGGMAFEKWMNNDYLPKNQDKLWIKEVSSKAVKQSMMNGQKAFNDFFTGRKGYPNFKKKKNQNVKAYFPKNNITDWTLEERRVKIPTLGFVKIKEKGYIPLDSVVTSGTVSCVADRYYLSVLCDIPDVKLEIINIYNDGVGVDLGVKDFLIASNGLTIKNINKSKKMKKLNKKLRREQRKLSRRYEFKKKSKKQERYKDIEKQVKVVQKIHAKITNIRDNHINQSVNILVKNKPKYITIEDLNIKGMMKNKHLSKAIASQNFYKFRTKLISKSKQNGVEIRLVSRWFPSSKTCSCCGFIHSNLRLRDRKFVCPSCNMKLDRDWNASINLRNAKEYTVA